MKLSILNIVSLLVVQVSGQAVAQDYGDYGDGYGDAYGDQYGGDYGGDTLYQDYADKQQKKIEGGNG